jgi:hypothetical protein
LLPMKVQLVWVKVRIMCAPHPNQLRVLASA